MFLFPLKDLARKGLSMADNSEDAEEGTSRLGGRSGCFLFLLFVLSQILFIVGFIVNTRVLM